MLKILETTDFDELTAAQEDWEVRHRPLNTGRFRGRLLMGRVGKMCVDLERWNVPLELSGRSPSDKLSFSLPLNDCSSYMSSGRAVTSDSIDIFRSECEISAQTKPQSALVSCTLPSDALGLLSEAPCETMLWERKMGHSVIRLNRRAIFELRQWWLKLLELSAQESIAPNVHERLLRETLSITVRALHTSTGNRESRPGRGYRLAQRARDFMLERTTDPPNILELCTFLNTSERTLHSSFHEVFSVSPKRFLKAQRLISARQALQSAISDQYVSNIALELGFLDLGRFARDYLSMFGEMPSATLRKEHGVSKPR